MTRAARSWISLLACGLLGACGASSGPGETRAPRGQSPAGHNRPARGSTAVSSPKETLAAATAKLPADTGPFYPSLLRTRGEAVDLATFADVKVCTRCHKEAGQQWLASAHAHASFDNPWYRASVDALREEAGLRASRHCAGCHDPLPLLAGKMDGAIDPQDPLATAGVTCLVCHSVEHATTDGNAGVVLATADVPIPEPGDPESLGLHRKRLAMPALRSPALCASCHRGFLGPDTGNPHHLFGMDEPGAWRASAFGGSRSQTLEPAEAQACRDCHMRRERASLPDPSLRAGALRSHRFAASHTALAAQVDPERQLAMTVDELRRSVRVDLPVLRKNGRPQLVTEPVTWQAGDEIALDVTVRSLRVGHAFPGGVKDLQDTWLELVVTDGAGRTIAHSGHAQPDGADPSTFFLRALIVDSRGVAETRHRVPHFGTVAYDHSVPALGARTVRYTFELDREVTAPLRARVRLHHRKHRRELREVACAATRSTRGQAFVAAARRRGLPVLDGCAPQPITMVATRDLVLGQPEGSADLPMGLRLYDHALGLSGTVQERLEEARFSAMRALQALSGTDDDNARANVLCLLGRIAARQGRTDEALAHAAQAQQLVGEQAASERVRADAYLQVWRFAEAATALERLVRFAPYDTAAHRDLARARLSARDPAGALRAAHAGLALQPRDEGLLRTQALALKQLGSEDAGPAHAAFLRYREGDVTMSSKLACDRMLPNCARDRMPVVTMALSTLPGP